MHLDFYMPLNFITRTPSFFIIPQHQPFISILTLNYTTILLNHWRNEIHQRLAQQSKQEKKYQKELATLFLHSPYLTFHRQLHKPFFNVVTPSTIHRLTQLLFFITHKQTKLPTHAFLIAAMDIFPLQACKKLMANENKKTKP